MKNNTSVYSVSRTEADALAIEQGATAFVDQYTLGTGHWMHWGRTYFTGDLTGDTYKEVGHYLNKMDSYTKLERDCPASWVNTNNAYPCDKEKMQVSNFQPLVVAGERL